MRIAVFGAAGWVGRSVLGNLRAHNHHVRAIDYDESAWGGFGDIDGDWRGDETVTADIGDYAATEADGGSEGSRNLLQHRSHPPGSGHGVPGRPRPIQVTGRL